MADGVINFRTAKKRVKAARKETQAAENRLKFGRTKAQKQRDISTAEKAAKHIDGHEREKE